MRMGIFGNTQFLAFILRSCLASLILGLPSGCGAVRQCKFGDKVHFRLLRTSRTGARSVECTLNPLMWMNPDFMTLHTSLGESRFDPRGRNGGVEFCCGIGRPTFRELVQSTERRYGGREGHCIIYIVMLRVTSSRIVSAFQTSLGRPEHIQVMGELAHKFEKETVTLDEYINAPERDKSLNHVVSLITQGWEPRDEALRSMGITKEVGQLMPDERLRLAIRLLEFHGVFVGLQERFEESLAMLGLLSAVPMRRFVRCSSLHESVQASEKQLEEITRQHSLDAELYRWGAATFEAQQRDSAASGGAPMPAPLRVSCAEGSKRCLDSRGDVSATLLPEAVPGLRAGPPGTDPAHNGRVRNDYVCWEDCQLYDAVVANTTANARDVARDGEL